MYKDNSSDTHFHLKHNGNMLSSNTYVVMAFNNVKLTVTFRMENTSDESCFWVPGNIINVVSWHVSWLPISCLSELGDHCADFVRKVISKLCGQCTVWHEFGKVDYSQLNTLFITKIRTKTILYLETLRDTLIRFYQTKQT